MKRRKLAYAAHSDEMSTYPVTFKRLYASTSLGCLVGNTSLAGGAELPHLDGPVEATADEVFATGRECDTVHTVLVPIGSFKALNKVAAVDVPNANALVKRSGCDQLTIGRDGNRSDAVLNGKGQDAASILNIPQSHSAVTTARSNGATIS